MADQIVQIGLIVTGKGEHEFLPAIFQSLGRTGTANFRTIGRTGQRSPITSKKRLLRMVGDKKIIPTEDEKQIGLPAHFFLQTSEHCCVMVIDDLVLEFLVLVGEVLLLIGQGGRNGMHLNIRVFDDG